MQPGDRYLSEADALQHHRVARGTYREGLRFLEIQGVVNIRAGPGGGPEIRRPGWPQLASTIALLLQFADAPMREVLEARTAIEPGVARMAALYATAQDIEVMADDLGHRPVLPVPGHPPVDESGVTRHALLRAEPKPLGHSRPKALHQDVRRLDEAEDDLGAIGVLQIDRDRAAPPMEQLG